MTDLRFGAEYPLSVIFWLNRRSQGVNWVHVHIQGKNEKFVWPNLEQ